MEKGNVQQKLSNSSDADEADEAGGDANEGIAATFNTAWQSCGVETLRKQLESACLNVNSEANDDECCNLESEDRGNEQSERPKANTLFDELDFRLPSPPSDSPEANYIHELADRRYEPCERPQINNPINATSAASADDMKDCASVSTDNFDSISSSLSERDSYTWSLASSKLPSLLAMNDGKERLIWPVEEEFPDHIGFEENIDYILRVRIAEGAFGECYLAAELPENKEREFCVKKCQCGHISELLALTLARQENVAEIVKFYGAKLKGRSASIFMEFMAGGTIAELIKDIKIEAAVREVVISETDSLGYLEDVLKALNFIHMKGIVHRDVKGANVLLTEDRLHAKLADFGSAESRQSASASIDIWKTGCLFLEMWNGERPSRLLGISELGFQRQNSCKPEDHIPPKAMPETKDLLRLCFGVNTGEENYLPSAAEVLEKTDVFPVKEFLRKILVKFKPSKSGEIL